MNVKFQERTNIQEHRIHGKSRFSEFVKYQIFWSNRCILSRKLISLFSGSIKPYPIHPHFYRQLRWIDPTYPATPELHIDQQIKGTIKWILSGFIGGNFWIGESMPIIDIKTKAIRSQLYRINIIIIGVYRTSTAFGWVSFPELNGVIRMNRLVCYRFVVESFHYIY